MITLSFRVVCAENYYGPDCSQFCTDNCACDPGFTGEFCQTNIDEYNCGNGVCVDGINSFICNCNTGYTGTLCNSDINECLSNPCGRNGQCMNQIGTFRCNGDQALLETSLMSVLESTVVGKETVRMALTLLLATVFLATLEFSVIWI